MRIQNFISLIIVLTFIFFSQSCKKNDPMPDPIPVVKPDTLGTGWTKKVISGETFSDVAFQSNGIGYVAGYKVYKTSNAGLTWDSIYPGVYKNIFITADNKAFFTGNAGTIERTIDGGLTFTSGSVGSGGVANDLFFVDNNTGYCITLTGLCTSIDAGVTWTTVATTGISSFYSGYSTIFATDATHGWIGKQDGIFKTSGSFGSWQKAILSGGSGNTFFYFIHAVSNTIVYATNEVGELYKSVDGGANFSFLSAFGTGTWADIHFFNELTGYACSGRFVFKTTDGGQNWTKVVSLGQDNLIELFFTDNNHGWACGSDGFILSFNQ